ncbi:MAG: hypothetical protein UY40_C0015G0006 [candidate division CPR1 bacterium GW2011_GWC1_49_13]|uniref:RNA-binding protein KhpA n=1 Tax=candidate division CPR1 bacterium GW2011_GWC1_49_13 TaxID=1618342 RepID=A0A0G1VH11_9BACT|nr:MAG: hypothetical protein UY40_C0015G0006 [candidate division CPR1 bacterium GW2011_GWC1_49_13]
MKELLSYLVKEIVSEPKKVKVTEEKEGEGLRLSVEVSPDDMGILIGKKGHTIQAVRSLVKTAAAKKGVNVFVELIEKE